MKVALTAALAAPPSAPFLIRGDFAHAFRTASELGCDGVEIMLRRAEDTDPDELKVLMSRYSLGVPTLGTGMAAGMDRLTFTDPDPAVRSAAVDRVCGHVRLAAAIGSAVTIGLVRGKLAARPPEQQRAARSDALHCLAQVCHAAAPLGVEIFLEPLNRYECDYINTLADGIAIAQQIGAPNLRLLADTFHMNMEEAGLESSLASASALLGHVHLADTNRQAPGRGHLDLPSILRTLHSFGYTRWFSLETLPLPDPIRAIQDSLSAIRAASSGLGG